MEDETLTDKFRSSIVPDSLYWSSSLDSRVQFAQSQGADGGKADTTTIYGEIQQRILDNRRKQSRETGEALAWALEEVLQRYNEATRAAEIALRELGTTIGTAREHFSVLNAQFEEHTIKLRDGTYVYYDTQASALVKQDEAGNWLTLEDEGQIQQALTAAADNDARMTTKQGKLALDEYEREIAYGAAFHADRRNLIAIIDDAVDKEAMPLEEAARFKEDIAESTTDMTARLRETGRRAELMVEPVDIQLAGSAFKSRTTKSLQSTTAPQQLTDEFRKLFVDDEQMPEDDPEQANAPESEGAKPSF